MTGEEVKSIETTEQKLKKLINDVTEFYQQMSSQP